MAAAWQQQQTEHPAPQPPTSWGATSTAGLVYYILPPGQQQLELQLQQQGGQEPLRIVRPEDLPAVSQWGLRHGQGGYAGSTLRGVGTRLAEHARELLAGNHTSLQHTWAPTVAALREQHGDGRVKAALVAHLASHTRVVAEVKSGDFGGDHAQLEVMVGAAEQALIDSCGSACANTSRIVGARFASMPGTCMASGAQGPGGGGAGAGGEGLGLGQGS